MRTLSHKSLHLFHKRASFFFRLTPTELALLVGRQLTSLVEIPVFSSQGCFDLPDVLVPLRFDGCHRADGLFKRLKSPAPLH